jgi:ABC-type nitrate/sulfonate/bicarbonate transport system substrate-binding protein
MKAEERTLAGFLGAAACGVVALGAVSVAAAQELRDIDVIIANDTTCSLYAPHLARITGMNEDLGINVNLLSSETKVPYVAFLSTGDADFVMLDAHETLNQAEAGEDNTVIYVTHQFAPEGIVVAADSQIGGLADLKGKTIGLADDSDLLTTQIALDSVGIDIEEVRTAVVGDSGPVLAKALREGAIDAFAGGSSDRTGIEAAGLTIRNITPIEVSENPGNSLVMANARKQDLWGATQAFLKAWAMSQHAGVMDTKGTMSVCRVAIPEQFENLVTGERLITNSAFVTQLRRTKDYGELVPDVWAKIQPPLVKMGVIKQFIEPATFLDAQYLQAANAWSTWEVRKYLDEWKAANPELVLR